MTNKITLDDGTKLVKIGDHRTTPKRDKTDKKFYVPVKFIRLVFYGGAKKWQDNDAFYCASRNVIRDYSADFPIIDKMVDSAKTIIDIINALPDNSIQSIDILCHGDIRGLYFIKGATRLGRKTISDDDLKNNNLAMSLYANKLYKALGSNLGGESRLLDDINYAKFTDTSKIEIHGCLTGTRDFLFKNICQYASEYLYSAGKKNSVVIGHDTKANPNIDGTLTPSQQDYRHGVRMLYNNGKVILKTNKNGRITNDDIKKAIGNKK